MAVLVLVIKTTMQCMWEKHYPVNEIFMWCNAEHLLGLLYVERISHSLYLLLTDQWLSMEC